MYKYYIDSVDNENNDNENNDDDNGIIEPKESILKEDNVNIHNGVVRKKESGARSQRMSGAFLSFSRDLQTVRSMPDNACRQSEPSYHQGMKQVGIKEKAIKAKEIEETGIYLIHVRHIFNYFNVWNRIAKDINGSLTYCGSNHIIRKKLNSCKKNVALHLIHMHLMIKCMYYCLYY